MVEQRPAEKTVNRRKPERAAWPANLLNNIKPNGIIMIVAVVAVAVNVSIKLFSENKKKQWTHFDLIVVPSFHFFLFRVFFVRSVILCALRLQNVH